MRNIIFLISLIMFIFFAGWGVMNEVFYAGVDFRQFSGIALTAISMIMLQSEWGK